MFDDIAVIKIKESDLETEYELGQGGFGVVKKMQLHMVGYKVHPAYIQYSFATSYIGVI